MSFANLPSLLYAFFSAIQGNSEEIKKAKKMSLLTHAALMILVVVSFKFGLMITAISLILPVVFCLLSVSLVITNKESSENVRLLDYVDTMMFFAHSLLLISYRFMPLNISLPIMLLNLMVSAQYVARIIDVAYSNLFKVELDASTVGRQLLESMFNPDNSASNDQKAVFAYMRSLSRNLTINNIVAAGLFAELGAQ